MRFQSEFGHNRAFPSLWSTGRKTLIADIAGLVSEIGSYK